MNRTRTLLLSLSITTLLTGCELSTGKKKSEAVSDNVVRSYTKDKKLKSEIPMKGKKRHGLAKIYYPNGKVNMEIEYVDDQKVGKSRRYYETGLLYQETDYKDDQMHGAQKKYGAAGLLSEARLEYGQPCTGLVEYIDGKDKRNDYPKILIKVIDRIQDDGTYTLRLSVTEGASTVKFYLGELTNSGCMHSGLSPLPPGPGKNTAEHMYRLHTGQFLMEELNFIAEVSTRSGNSYLTVKQFPLSIEN